MHHIPLPAVGGLRGAQYYIQLDRACTPFLFWLYTFLLIITAHQKAPSISGCVWFHAGVALTIYQFTTARHVVRGGIASGADLLLLGPGSLKMLQLYLSGHAV